MNPGRSFKEAHSIVSWKILEQEYRWETEPNIRTYTTLCTNLLNILIGSKCGFTSVQVTTHREEFAREIEGAWISLIHTNWADITILQNKIRNFGSL